MSAGTGLIAVTACAAVSAGSLALCIGRGWSGLRSLPRPERGLLPWPVRLALLPAALLEPLLPASVMRLRAARTGQLLESLGLLPALTPLRWETIRLVYAAAATVAVAALPGDCPWLLAALAAAFAWLVPGIWLNGRLEHQHRDIGRELPAWLDLITVCIEAGASLTSAIRLIVEQSPDSPLRGYFERVLREIRGGRPRAQAFAQVAESYGVESLGTLAASLAHAESSGMSLGQVLRAQAEQRSAERFARAERLAMQAPVKMLGPLILCIFPCTFIVIGVPIAVRLMEALGS